MPEWPEWANTLVILVVVLAFVASIPISFRLTRDRWRRAFFILASLVIALALVQVILIFGGEGESESWVKRERIENGVLIVECFNGEGALIDCPEDP